MWRAVGYRDYIDNNQLGTQGSEDSLVHAHHWRLIAISLFVVLLLAT